MNRRIAASTARQNLATLIDAVRTEDERVVLTQYSRDVVALIPIDDLRLLEELEDRSDLAEVRRRTSRRAGAISLDQLERKLQDGRVESTRPMGRTSLAAKKKRRPKKRAATKMGTGGRHRKAGKEVPTRTGRSSGAAQGPAGS